jgi:hypothetical protein
MTSPIRRIAITQTLLLGLLLIVSAVSAQRFIEPDDYPFTNEMLKQGYNRQDTGHLVYSSEAWFKNSASNQFLAVELYTDYHKLEIHHAYSWFRFPHFTDRLPLLQRGRGWISPIKSDSLRQVVLPQYIKAAIEIDARFFRTRKGISLGMSDLDAQKRYGPPISSASHAGVQIVHWQYPGDREELSTNSTDTTYIAKDSFGYEVTMYFARHRLVAMRLSNAIP